MPQIHVGDLVRRKKPPTKTDGPIFHVINKDEPDQGFVTVVTWMLHGKRVEEMNVFRLSALIFETVCTNCYRPANQHTNGKCLFASTIWCRELPE